VPHDLTLKTMNLVHKGLLAVTGGRFGWTVAGMPALELTTTGRRSGEPRTVWLTSPVREGAALVIVASRGGDDNAPAWFLNLVDQPDVQVRLQGKEFEPMRARVATAEERERLWPEVVAGYSGYAAYQRKTEREIPLVLLEPVAR
jgi:deazaflavin-dependent oxidoreductase (nitroreductase family)